MKNAFLMVVILMVYGCDNREDYFELKNQAPTIKVLINATEIATPLVKDSIKIGYPRQYSILVVDEEQLTVTVKADDALTVSGNELTSVSASTPGIKSIELSVTDSYGRTTVRSMQLTSFINLKPVVKFTVVNLGDREVEVDASTSRDGDFSFGGRITIYEYTFNGTIVESSLNKVRFRFGSVGSKRIEVRVRDNNSEWSDKKDIYITV